MASETRGRGRSDHCPALLASSTGVSFLHSFLPPDTSLYGKPARIGGRADRERGICSRLKTNQDLTQNAAPALEEPLLLPEGRVTLLVNLLVAFEVLPAAEVLATVAAVVGLLPRVDPHVFGEVPSLAEAALALAAAVRLLPGVGPLVDLQVGQSAERLPAQETHVFLLPHQQLHPAPPAVPRSPARPGEPKPPAGRGAGVVLRPAGSGAAVRRLSE